MSDKIVDGVREIDGIRFHIKGKELIEILTVRVKQHTDKAKSLEVDYKTAADAMAVATEAAAKAGKSAHGPRGADGGGGGLETYSASPMRARVAVSSANRSYGGNIEDPVAALEQAVIYHTQRASQLKFYAAHLLADVVYVLGENEIQRYELLGAVSEDEG